METRTKYGMEVNEPLSVDLEAVLNREEPKENVTAPKGYGKKLYEKARQIYREAGAVFKRGDEREGEKYNALVGELIMLIGMAAGTTSLTAIGAIMSAIGIGWGLGGLGEYYASFTVSDKEDGKKAVGRGGLL